MSTMRIWYANSVVVSCTNIPLRSGGARLKAVSVVAIPDV